MARDSGDELNRPRFHIGLGCHGCPGSRLLLIVVGEDFELMYVAFCASMCGGFPFKSFMFFMVTSYCIPADLKTEAGLVS